MENYDILLLQEHWLFHAQLHYLQEIGKCTNYAAKGSDEYDPIQPTFLPRGHGGVAVIWKNEIDSQVRPLDDGKERIQCVEISGKDQKLLLVSVYLPSTGGRNSTDEFLDTIDQLNEIITKYQDTHEIIIGGDLNEDLGNDERQNKRKKYLQQLIEDYRLGYENTGKTFIKTNGQECSELDYFLYKSRHMEMTEKEVLKDVISNHSDHYPIKCEVKIGIPKRGTNQNSKLQQLQPTIKWDKVDQDLYLAIINRQVDTMAESPAETADDAELLISKMHQMLTNAANESSSNKSKYKAKPKLKVWTPIIKGSLKEMRKCYDIWSRNGKPTNPDDKSYQDRVNSRKEFKKQVKVEQARERDREKQEILEARTRDSKLYHKLVKGNRNRNRTGIMDLHVNDNLYSGDQVIEGFTEHFGNLASAEKSSQLKDQHYHELVEYEIKLINDMVKSKETPLATQIELKKAIKTLNRGKSADIYGITVEHLIYAGEKLEQLLLRLINLVFKHGYVPDILKKGLLAPVFKNKGDRCHAANYRGITVLPVVNKIIEAIIRDRIQPRVLKDQNPTQRGFTAKSSPLNAGLVVEEVYRESVDSNQEFELVLLDAKSAFDVVVHSHLMRRLFHCGIDDTLWRIIQSMHWQSTSAIKWEGMIADEFPVSQGVRQGGILSTDLYKVNVNPLLNRLQQSGLGCKIGNVLCNTTACADDIALLGKRPPDMQVQINISADYAGMEGYKLQPQKSVAIHIKPKPTKNNCEPEHYQLGKDPMPNVTKSTHLGIIRTTSMRQNIESNVEENVKKARRSAYALFGSGFHGENGLDPESLIHLYKTYISPVLLYGMELLTPKSAHLETLEKFQKKMLKQILSVPMSTPDPAVYILTGILPVEAQIHTKMMTFFSNICQQSDNSVEKQLGKRQLAVKSSGSHSWYIEVQRVMFKYNLGRAIDMLRRYAQYWCYVCNVRKMVIEACVNVCI
ncbi:uncharacterized protein LOC134711049 [Mytilus trossulus]|uniref:uncharacterized protein LOC134711049 n=1 Tax=Mytilus trossulus TaxID=6551 RepID=UPI003003D1D8